MNVNVFEEKYGININFLDLTSLVCSIPKEWRKNIICMKTKLDRVCCKSIEVLIQNNKLCCCDYKKLNTNGNKFIKEIANKWSNVLGYN